LPDGDTGHDCLADPVFFADIITFWLDVMREAAAAGRQAG